MKSSVVVNRGNITKKVFVQQIMALSEHLTLGFKSQWEE